jgi:hypothetical protein
MSYSRDELLELGMELINAAELKKAPLRLLGGLAYYINSPQARTLPQFNRKCKDLDFAITSRGSRYITQIFKNHGWTDDAQFNALHGSTRMLFYYGEQNELQADIFVGVFEQCHTINLEKRLALSTPTIPLSDLLLTKLEIHQLNKKDITDIVMLLYDHDFGMSGPKEKDELDYIVKIAADDWGWYTTITDNLELVKPMLKDYVQGKDLQRLENTINWIDMSIRNAPKTMKWKMRNVIGRRAQWYELPEEVNR